MGELEGRKRANEKLAEEKGTLEARVEVLEAKLASQRNLVEAAETKTLGLEVMRQGLETDLASSRKECDLKGRVMEQLQTLSRGKDEAIGRLTKQIFEHHESTRKLAEETVEARVTDLKALFPLEKELRMPPYQTRIPSKEFSKNQFTIGFLVWWQR